MTAAGGDHGAALRRGGRDRPSRRAPAAAATARPALILGAAAAAAALLLAGCTPPPSPPPSRYLVGEPYALGGIWSYPREDFALAETGLAAVAHDTRAGRATANGEIHDPARASAAHRTLQLPAALRVTNLENGRSLLLRVNDRGPADAGRVVELSRRAAELLGIPANGTAQLRIAVAAEESRALASGLRPAATAADAPPPIRVAAAPRAAVAAESLAPPPGARAAADPRRSAGPGPPPPPPAAPAAEPAAAAAAPPHAIALPERVEQGAPAPGRLVVEAGTFSHRDAAARQARRLARAGARVEAVGEGRRQQFRVRIGPLGSVAEADRILEQVLASGVSEARIRVE